MSSVAATSTSSTTSATTITSVLEKRLHTDIKDLLDYQKDIKKNLKNVEKKIFSLEQSYLDETPGGNVIRGWDGEAKPINKRGVEPKERLFSNSSYHVFQNYKPIQDELAIEAKIIASNTKATKTSQQGGKTKVPGAAGEPKKKKKRKARKEVMAKPAKKLVAPPAYDNEWVAADY